MSFKFYRCDTSLLGTFTSLRSSHDRKISFMNCDTTFQNLWFMTLSLSHLKNECWIFSYYVAAEIGKDSSSKSDNFSKSTPRVAPHDINNTLLETNYLMLRKNNQITLFVYYKTSRTRNRNTNKMWIYDFQSSCFCNQC